MIYLLDSTKVSFILSHAHHAHVLLFLLYTVLSQSVLFGLRFIHNSVFSLPPTLCSDWSLCFALRLLFMFTIYLARPERISSRSLLYSSTSIRLIIYIIVLYWTRSNSVIRFRVCGTAVLLPNKRSGREVQPLAALYPTVRLSSWRQIRAWNIHSRVWTPAPTWSVLRPGGSPLMVPLSSLWLGNMGLTPGNWSGLLSRVATPGTTRSCLPPGGLLSWEVDPKKFRRVCMEFSKYNRPTSQKKIVLKCSVLVSRPLGQCSFRISWQIPWLQKFHFYDVTL